MKVLGITFARGGSVGVPHKNIRDCAGKPLIAWTIEEALKCKLLDRYIVSTDSTKIAKIAREHGAEVPFDEPYSDGKNPLLERIVFALEQLEKDGEYYDIVADIRCTNAMKEFSDIDGAIKKLIRTGADTVCGTTQLVDHHPSRIKMVVDDRLIDVWPEPKDGLRQSLTPKVYIRNGSFYIMTRDAVDSGIHFSGGIIRPWEMPIEKSVNIDTELDFLVTEKLLEMRHEDV